LQRETDLFAGRPLRLLHPAPEPMLKKRFRALNHLDYLSVDIESSLADEKMDLTQLDLDDQASIAAIAAMCSSTSRTIGRR